MRFDAARLGEEESALAVAARSPGALPLLLSDGKSEPRLPTDGFEEARYSDLTIEWGTPDTSVFHSGLYQGRTTTALDASLAELLEASASNTFHQSATIGIGAASVAPVTGANAAGWAISPVTAGVSLTSFIALALASAMMLRSEGR